jgi:hypothetical protein
MRRCGTALASLRSVAESLRQRTLQRALEIVGRPAALSRRLRVPLWDLRLWLAGIEAPPTATFLEAVDIVVQYEGQPPRENAPLLERRRHPRSTGAMSTDGYSRS